MVSGDMSVCGYSNNRVCNSMLRGSIRLSVSEESSFHSGKKRSRNLGGWRWKEQGL